LKPGERKIISDGTKGPVVEIIRKTETDQPAETEAQEAAVEEDSETMKPVERTDTEAAGE
jgi:small subunit ribosomal protein S2